MKCLICGTESIKLFSAELLCKYNVDYHKCPHCGFIQTDKPYWLDEAYSDAIASMDIGLVYRNLIYSNQVDNLIKTSFDYKAKFLDYAGGYGLYVRIMRDKGFDFYWDDKFCKNLFAKYFTLDDLPSNQKFEAVTAFEIFEHLDDPMTEIEKLFGYADSIIFSTELIPNKEITSSNDWWYFATDGGQHISFYTKQSFEYIAKSFKCNFYSNGKDLHILTKKKFDKNPLAYKRTTWDKIADRLNGLINSTKSGAVPYIQLPSKISEDVKYMRDKVNELDKN